jgi:hypothetical protein
MKDDKKEFLYYDLDEHTQFLNYEAESKELLADIVISVNNTIGANILFNYEMLLEKGIDFLVDEYRKLYLEKLPPHLDFKAIIEQQTATSFNLLHQQISEYNHLVRRMGNQVPSIDFSGVLISNVKKAKFNKYLDQSKKDFYEYIKKLLALADELNQYIDVSNTKEHLIRFVAFRGLKGFGNELEINLKYFVDEK